MRWLAIIFALLSTPALSQDPVAPDVTAAANAPVNRAPDCSAWQLKPSARGDTVLAVRVSVSGDVLAASVQHTSGNRDLDAAALACSEHMHIAPPTRDGKPVEATWIVVVGWLEQTSSLYFVPHVEDRTACEYPFVAWSGGVVGAVVLSVHIGADGKVQKAAIEKSSGAEILDKASLRCASSWVFPPALIDGRPDEIDWTSAILWDQGPHRFTRLCVGEAPPIFEVIRNSPVLRYDDSALRNSSRTSDWARCGQ
jgi:TonB family protein